MTGAGCFPILGRRSSPIRYTIPARSPRLPPEIRFARLLRSRHAIVDPSSMPDSGTRTHLLSPNLPLGASYASTPSDLISKQTLRPTEEDDLSIWSNTSGDCPPAMRACSGETAYCSPLLLSCSRVWTSSFTVRPSSWAASTPKSGRPVISNHRPDIHVRGPGVQGVFLGFLGPTRRSGSCYTIRASESD